MGIKYGSGDIVSFILDNKCVLNGKILYRVQGIESYIVEIAVTDAKESEFTKIKIIILESNIVKLKKGIKI